jgi:hypothetical protein
VQADLRDPATLGPALSGVDAVVHFAGVLFAPRPERFLPETNTRWFDHLVAAALEARVARLILVSFPHVEGPTSTDEPATGRLDREPVSVHARTRLAEVLPPVLPHARVRSQDALTAERWFGSDLSRNRRSGGLKSDFRAETDGSPQHPSPERPHSEAPSHSGAEEAR